MCDPSKLCASCKHEKPLVEFGKTKGRPNSYCKKCMVARSAKWRIEHYEKHAAYQLARVKKPEKSLFSRRKSYLERHEVNGLTKEDTAAYMREYRLRPDVKEKLKDARHKKSLTPEYRASAAARVSKRRALKKQRQCYDQEFTNFVMKEARLLAEKREKSFGFEWHVDHIVPLNSKSVCGLHVWANFELLPSEVNRKKSNKYWPDMPE